MITHGLESLIAEHPVFHGLDEGYIKLITGCGKNVRFAAGEVVFAEDEPADWFYLLRSGRVALETPVPGHGARTIQTIEQGDVLGWSWLFPPYKWTFSARATEPTRAVAMDGACLRKKCEGDPGLGYELMKRFAGVMMQRLHAARLQMLDIYG